jgi:hypothetical protein
MIRRLVVLLSALPLLAGCKGEGAPGAFEKFLPPIGVAGALEEMCSDANDGKRFWLEGHLQVPTSGVTILGKKTNLAFYARLDGNGRGAGRSISINVTSPGDIDDLRAVTKGRHGEFDPDDLRIRTTNGTATPRDRIKLTFDLGALNLNDKRLATCAYQFVKAEKL